MRWLRTSSTEIQPGEVPAPGERGRRRAYSAFHILDTGDPIEELHLYGIRYLDWSWMIDFVFYNDIPDPLTDEERQVVMDSILASFETHRESATSSAP